MNDIETLLRESLQSTPMPDTRLADPVSSIDRRARRARALIAGGVAAVAIVVTAAVLVPMQVSRGGDGDAKLTGVAFLAGSAWVATGSAVWEVDSSGRHVATVNLPGGTLEQGIVATDSGQLWVAQERSWLRIDPASHRVVDTVQWSGPMLAAAGRDAIWTYDGRLVALTPALLHQGQAAAEGSSVRVPGRVTAVARSTENGLFVVAWNGEDVSQSSGLLYYLSERTLTGTAAITRQTPFAPVSPYELAPDGAGGVNFSTSEANDEVGMHWSP
jgi:hypothetical protein